MSAELQDWPAEPAERAKLVVERMLDELELEGDVEVQEGEERIDLSVESDEDLGLLIGRRGQTIDALQLLCYQAAYRGREDRKRVVVDAAGYRDRRRETIAARAESAAERALSSGDGIEMDPMSPQERRVVHEHLKDRPGIETYSEGDEPHRFVVVAPIISE